MPNGFSPIYAKAIRIFIVWELADILQLKLEAIYKEFCHGAFTQPVLTSFLAVKP